MSVLDDMTKGIMTTKATKAARLTPVKGEQPNTVAEEASRLPNDVPGVIFAREGVADIARDLRKQAEYLTNVADGLDVILGVPEAVERQTKAEADIDRKLAEKEADRKAAGLEEPFANRMARLAAEAQAATFAAADDGGEDVAAPVVAPATGGWTCKVHGDSSLTQLVSRANRKYMACQATGCKQFEK